MWAEKCYACAPSARHRAGLAGGVLRDLRIRKTAEEIDALREAGAAIDRVHDRIAEWLKPAVPTGDRPGHRRGDRGRGTRARRFLIVGSGPNGASTHHDVSDRVVQVGDPVVVDIGGTHRGRLLLRRNPHLRGGEPDAEFRRYYEVLLAAQKAPLRRGAAGYRLPGGGPSGPADHRRGRYGEYFIHRTGHGIGLERGTEDPYIVEWQRRPLGARYGLFRGAGNLPARPARARIEDIRVARRPRGAAESDTP